MTTAGETARVREASRELLRHIGPAALKTFSDGIERGRPRDAALAVITMPEAQKVARSLLDVANQGDDHRACLVECLRSLADGFVVARDLGPVVELVWGGPSSSDRQKRATSETLLSIIDETQRELVIMTYSAAPYGPVVEALAEAAARGVAISVVVETLAGAGGAITGREPAAAFLTVPGLRLWHWPITRRRTVQAKQHAKLVLADESVLLVTSANLTASGVGENLEAGVMIRGGLLPRECGEHIRRLQTDGVLTRIAVSDN